MQRGKKEVSTRRSINQISVMPEVGKITISSTSFADS